MNVPDKISSITALHNLFRLKKPLHPLISVFDLDEATILHAVYTDFYVITLKKNCVANAMLRTCTEQTTQQPIQNRLIERAKKLLSTTGLSVSEITYRLGFEHPQSFHRLFKNQTSVFPVQCRQSFNL